jgi:nicotinate dehydrogenase subunit A
VVGQRTGRSATVASDIVCALSFSFEGDLKDHRSLTDLIVNDDPVSLDLPDDTLLLDALRNHLGLFGPRFGCGGEQCGCCMILVDDKAMTSCATSLDVVAGRNIRTVEGLGSPDSPHPLQEAFLAEQAGQCGYCLSGMLIASAALLMSNPSPDEATVRDALDGNLCRCGSHNRIVRAVLRAAETLKSRKPAAAHA